MADDLDLKLHPDDRGGGRCQDCGAMRARTWLNQVYVCDACFDGRISAASGWPRLPAPPPPETLTGADGRRRRFRYRLWRSPGGLAAEAEELPDQPDADWDPEAGYHFSLVEDHDTDPETLIAALKALVRRGIAEQFLVPATHRPGWATTDLGRVDGRLVSNQDDHCLVVVDGRQLSWEELGQALDAYQGWWFRLTVHDGSPRGPAS